MILVLGGGFGLYGHLAALVEAGHTVSAPLRYRPSVEARPELSGLAPLVIWIDDEREAASRAATLALVRRPQDNAELARWAVEGGSPARLVIEKPVAPDWRQADMLEAALAAAGRPWAVPYLFLHCDWFSQVAEAVHAGRTIRIDWMHRQSPAVQNWKKDARTGGGAASFYFIHALAVLTALYPGTTPLFTHRRHGDGERIDAQAGLLTIGFTLADAMSFKIHDDGMTVVDDASPFGPLPMAGLPDPRIPILQRFYASLDASDARGPEFYRSVTRIWRALDETS